MGDGKILMRSLSTATTGKSVALTQVEENNINSLINRARILPFPRSSSSHHTQLQEYADNKATGCGCGCHSEQYSCNYFLPSSSTQNAVALMATLDSANHKKINAVTHCLFSPFPRPEDCSSSTIKLTNTDNIAPLASFLIKPNCIDGHLGLTTQPEFQAAQPNARPSYAHDTPPDQQPKTVIQRGVLVNLNFSTFTSSTKQKLDAETSLEPPEITSSEHSPCASVYSNKMNTKRNCQQTGDSESHCNVWILETRVARFSFNNISSYIL